MIHFLILIIGAALGIFTIGIVSGGAYDKGYEDCKEDMKDDR